MKAYFSNIINPLYLQILFWIASILFWNIYHYTSADPESILINSNPLYFILFVSFLIVIYFLLPLIWLIKRIKVKIKIITSFVFLLILGFWFIKGLKLYGQYYDYVYIIRIFTNFFQYYFLYVLVFHITIIPAVIINLKVLIPRFLNKIRFRMYLLTAISIIAMAATLNFGLFNYGIDKLIPKLYYISYYKIWELCLIIATYMLITSVVFLIWQYRQLLVAKRESVQNELSLLKAQINPHFLFNNLNTIYGMALQKNDRTPKTILQLSDFLRYVLYDTSSETIELEKEVEIIRNYVNLQMERINPEITTVDFITKGDFKDVEIAPLLLLPLVENCFKYGKGKSKGMIKINIDFDGDQMQFTTENKITRHEKPKGDKNGGIGINNVEKRLNLIYPGHFTLYYGETEEIFKLEMIIKLDKYRKR